MPKRHYQFALTSGKGLVGFLVARVAGGEYGRPEEVVCSRRSGSTRRCAAVGSRDACSAVSRT